MSDDLFTCGICDKKVKKLGGHYKNVHSEYYVKGKSSQAYVDKPKQKGSGESSSSTRSKDPRKEMERQMKNSHIPKGALQSRTGGRGRMMENFLSSVATRVISFESVPDDLRDEDLTVAKSVRQTRAARDEKKKEERSRLIALEKEEQAERLHLRRKNSKTELIERIAALEAKLAERRY